jgi:sialic acid synthase SpsE/sugar phosphate isomerase/epimerase
MSKISNLSSHDFYTIAEVGVNHNGSIDEALFLIGEAATAGVDAVKFQKRALSEIYVTSLLDDPNSAEWSFQYLIPQLKQLELAEDDFRLLEKEAHRLGLDFIVTPFDQISADFVANLKIDAVKFSSADLRNWPLISHALKKISAFPIFSTGMWDDIAIRRCSDFIKKLTPNYALLLCQSTYPASFDSLNLRYIETLKELAPVVGYSGHERGVDASVLAYCLGARIIEKHITRDPTQLGPDHLSSLTGAEFTELIVRLKSAKTALGENKKIVTQAELLNKEVFAKSVVAKYDLDVGDRITLDNIKFMCPGKGISPDNLDDILGKSLENAKKSEEYINLEDFAKGIKIEDWPPFEFAKKWGVKCRFHDFHIYKGLKTPVVEFHCSDVDVTGDAQVESKDSALIIHAPEVIGRELFDLCSRSPRIVKTSVDILQKTILKARALAENFRAGEKAKIVLHVGGMSSAATEFDSYNLTTQAERVLRDLDCDGIDLLPENLPPRPWYLGGQWYQYGFMKPHDMADFCKSLSLGMTFDVCHAQLYCHYSGTSLREYTEIVLPYIHHIHISDAQGNSGEGVQIESGDIDFDELFRHLENINFSWVPEIWSGHVNNGLGTYRALCCLEKYGHSGSI